MGSISHQAPGSVGGAVGTSSRHAGLRFRVPLPRGQQDDRLLYLGDDEAGVPLEVMAVELEGDDLYVIHAMRLRVKSRADYEEARKWRD